jgi:hypothetical protein
MPDQAVATFPTVCRSPNRRRLRDKVQRPVGGGCERSSLPRGQPADSELQANPAGLDGCNPNGQHGLGHAGSAVRFRKIGRLRSATLQYRPLASDSVFSSAAPC